MAKDNIKKDHEMQRQLLEATQSQNTLLQHTLLLGQQAMQYCKPEPNHILQPNLLAITKLYNTV